MRPNALALMTFVLPVLLMSPESRAAVPPLMPVQGILTDAGGNPLHGGVEVTFSIYPASSGGSALWSEIQNLEAERGLFTAYLGSEAPMPLDIFRDNQDLYLGIQVDQDSEMSRIRLGATPYSACAEYTHAQTLADMSCSAGELVRWDGSVWACSGDQDMLAGLSCTTGQSPEWTGTAWACGDDDGIETVSDEFAVQAGRGSCATGCTASLDLGVWRFCALTKFESEIYDNYGNHYHDRNRCQLDMDAGSNWQLNAFYLSTANSADAGFTSCVARCFN